MEKQGHPVHAQTPGAHRATLGTAWGTQASPSGAERLGREATVGAVRAGQGTSRPRAARGLGWHGCLRGVRTERPSQSWDP